VNGFNGTGTSTMSGGETSGRLGQAQDFDGVTDFIEIPDNSLNRLNANDFTTSVWINASNTNQTGPIIVSVIHLVRSHNFRWAFLHLVLVAVQ